MVKFELCYFFLNFGELIKRHWYIFLWWSPFLWLLCRFLLPHVGWNYFFRDLGSFNSEIKVKFRVFKVIFITNWVFELGLFLALILASSCWLKLLLQRFKVLFNLEFKVRFRVFKVIFVTNWVFELGLSIVLILASSCWLKLLLQRFRVLFNLEIKVRFKVFKVIFEMN